MSSSDLQRGDARRDKPHAAVARHNDKMPAAIEAAQKASVRSVPERGALWAKPAAEISLFSAFSCSLSASTNNIAVNRLSYFEANMFLFLTFPGQVGQVAAQ